MLALLVPGVGMGGGAAVVVADPLFSHAFTLRVYRGPQAFDFTVRRSQDLTLTVVRENAFDLTLEEQ